MLRERFFFFVMLTNVFFFGGGRTIQKRTPKFDIASNTSRTLDQLANKNFHSKLIEAKRLKSKTVNNDIHAEHSDEKRPKASNGSDDVGESCPYQSKELCLIFSLSKIAKVQVATPDRGSANRRLKERIFDNKSGYVENSYIDRRVTESEGKRVGFVEHREDENFEDFSKKRLKSSNVHCRAIRDVYIPEAKQNLPAFTCKFGNNTFVLSSARFLEDRRSYLDINVNENAFENIKFPPKISRSNELNVIPALLVLNVANNDYRIEMQKIANEKSIRREEIDKKLSDK